MNHELDARLFNGRSKPTREFRGERREVRRFESGVDAARLDTREIQKRIHEPQQAQGIAMRDLLPFSMHRRQGCPDVSQTICERSDQQGQRCAEFVADITEKCRLRTIELRQRLGPLSLLLVRPCVGDRRATLICHQINERTVLIIEGTLGIEADDQSCGPRLLARRKNGEVLDQFGPRARELFRRSRCRTLQLVTQVREREQDVLRFGGERLSGENARLGYRPRGGVARGEVPQQGHASLAHHALRRFGDDAIDTADVA